MENNDNIPSPSSTTDISEKDKELSQNLQKAIAEAVRAANTLPKLGDTYELHATYKLFNQFMNTERSRITMMMKGFLKHSGCKNHAIPKTLNDMEILIDSNDTLVERASIAFDEFQAMLNAERLNIQQKESGAEPVPGGSAVMLGHDQRVINPTATYGHDKSGRYAILSTLPEARKTAFTTPNSSRPIKHHGLLVQTAIQKPQVLHSFQDKINNADTPFVPKLHVKHHTIQMPESRVRIIDENDCSMRYDWQNDADISMHPYQAELDHFKVPESQLKKRLISKVHDLKDIPLKFVKTVDQLNELIHILNNSKEFAVDLEHHEYRSYLGLTCLIQISVHDADYIIDPFSLWSELHLLNEPFTNPRILKVFHSGESDIEWLQRDFGVYVVNMFDTFEAMELLGLHPKSYKSLVQQFCGVELNKEFQRTDWRVRPLSEDHIAYARSDTRYLLHALDGIQNRLLSEGNEYKNLLVTTYEKSKRICLRAFQQPRFDPDGYLSLKGRRTLNNRQLYALKEIWKWRDSTAREEDESLDYVLPNHMLLQIAEVLPKEQNGIFACCAPIPLLVKRDVKYLHGIVKKALDLPLEKVNTSTTVEELINASRNAQIVDSENKITKQKAKLHPRLDFSMIPVEDQIPALNDRLKTTPSQIKEKAGFELPIALDIIKSGNSFVQITDEVHEKRELNPRLNKILKKINDWATPFDCYLIAMKENEKESKNRSDVTEEKEETATVLYSHHDEANIRVFGKTNDPSSSSSKPTMETQASLLEDELNKSFPGLRLTKKQKQRIKKQMDINLKPEDNKNEGKNRRGQKREHNSPSTSSNEAACNTGKSVADYSNYDPQMFYQKPDTSKVYNPFKSGGSKQKKQRAGKDRNARLNEKESNRPRTERS